MNYNDDLTLQFYEHLVKEHNETYGLLKPYFEAVQARENAGMNLYGAATFHDQVLLGRLQIIGSLKNQLSICGSFEKLKNALIEQKDASQEKNGISSIEAQLRYVDEWLNKKNGEIGVSDDVKKTF